MPSVLHCVLRVGNIEVVMIIIMRCDKIDNFETKS